MQQVNVFKKLLFQAQIPLSNWMAASVAAFILFPGGDMNYLKLFVFSLGNTKTMQKLKWNVNHYAFSFLLIALLAFATHTSGRDA